DSDVDAFYQAWVDDLLGRSLRALLAELHAENRGDYFRALYGRLCEGLTAAELAQGLNVSAATIENYLRVAKSRLAHSVQGMLRQQVERYTPASDIDVEFENEWRRLHAFLEQFGGLEAAIQQEAANLPNRTQPSAVFLAMRNAQPHPPATE